MRRCRVLEVREAGVGCLGEGALGEGGLARSFLRFAAREGCRAALPWRAGLESRQEARFLPASEPLGVT